MCSAGHITEKRGGVGNTHTSCSRCNRLAERRGFNHIAIEVGDIEQALEFYGRLFEIELRGRGPKMAFIDAGD